MRYTRLGTTDLDVSVVALGCGNFGGIGSAPELFGRGEDEATAYGLMDAAREHGITLFDTANAYGGGVSEQWVGRWLADRGARDEVVLTTKVRNEMPDGSGSGLSATQIRRQCEASLRRLRTDHVDLYLAHAPDPHVPIAETLGAFGDLVEQGLTRHVGLSNYTGATLVEAVDTGIVPLANLQSGYSLLDRAASVDFGVCAAAGIGFTAYSPLAGGWLAGKYRPGAPYPAGSRMTLRPDPYRDWETPEVYSSVDRLAAEATGRGLSLPVLALAWVLTDPGVAACIVGPRRPEQLADALAAAELSLTDEERATIGGGRA